MRPHLRSFGAAALLLTLLSGLVLLVSGPGYRIGIWSLSTGLSLLRWGVYGGLLAALVAGIGLWKNRGRSPLAILALAAAVAIVAMPVGWQLAARSAPPIHDITTDTANPPTFSAVVPLRTDARNSLDYSQETARQQREAYPDIAPLVLEIPAAQVFDRAVRAAREAGWEIVSVDAESWRIEATDTTSFFGFEDDVVVRLTPIGGRTVVDVRSVSRIGRGDVGTNAERVREYLAAVSR